MGPLLQQYFNLKPIRFASWGITYQAIFIFFILISILAFYLYRLRRERILWALLVTTWFSVLCPFAWIFIAKSHAIIHWFIDPIVFHMPFILMGTLLTAVTLRQMCIEVIKRN
jgi:hypothetical protein